jgi:hypothetical protein
MNLDSEFTKALIRTVSEKESVWVRTKPDTFANRYDDESDNLILVLNIPMKKADAVAILSKAKRIVTSERS